VQTTILKKEYDKLKKKENRLSEMPSEYEEIIESLTEEEKEMDILNEAGDAFVAKELAKRLKEIVADTQEMKIFKEKLKKADKLLKEEKELRAEVKKETIQLHILTKETIENLSDEQAYMLLEKKWTQTLIQNLNGLPDMLVDKLIDKVQALCNKYSVTYYEIEKQIKETEKQLCDMIDELEGDEFDMKGLKEFKKLLGGE